MLSIIVSSYQKDYFDQFSENVNLTIGENFVYEIIQIWNPGAMGICEAYNKGAEQAKYDNLLFVHEDVFFETEDWGKILCNYLREDKTGCLGIAGSSIKTLFPTAWWEIKENDFLHLNQKYQNNQIREFRVSENNNEVILLDGVFIGVRKNVWKEIKFNENLLKGFHAYDVDFSVRVSKKYKNYVNNDILITHLSNGNVNKNWFEDIIKVYKESKGEMKTFNAKEINRINVIEIFFRQLREYNFSKNEKIKLFFHFYSPLKYNVNDTIRIFKMINFYLNK